MQQEGKSEETEERVEEKGMGHRLCWRRSLTDAATEEHEMQVRGHPRRRYSPRVYAGVGLAHATTHQEYEEEELVMYSMSMGMPSGPRKDGPTAPSFCRSASESRMTENSVMSVKSSMVSAKVGAWAR